MAEALRCVWRYQGGVRVVLLRTPARGPTRGRMERGACGFVGRDPAWRPHLLEDSLVAAVKGMSCKRTKPRSHRHAPSLCSGTRSRLFQRMPFSVAHYVSYMSN